MKLYLEDDGKLYEILDDEGLSRTFFHGKGILYDEVAALQRHMEEIAQRRYYDKRNPVAPPFLIPDAIVGATRMEEKPTS